MNLSAVPITHRLNPSFGSFDNFGSSMLILYVMSTGDMWEEFMWAGMDAKGVDVAPERNDHSLASRFGCDDVRAPRRQRALVARQVCRLLLGGEGFVKRHLVKRELCGCHCS